MANMKPKPTKRPTIEVSADVESGGRIQASANTNVATADAYSSEMIIRRTRARRDSIGAASAEGKGSATCVAGGLYGLRSISYCVMSVHVVGG